jgi:hypothetical protein
MMRHLLSLFTILTAASLWAQLPYGNEWIDDYSRPYWKFKIVTDGLARIDSAALANAGFPVTTVDPRDIMIFNREKQIPIYVQGEADGIFNTGDFIEFNTKKNDAWIDQRVYALPQHVANPYYSLFNDTICYYITYDPSTSVEKERIELYENTNYDPYAWRPWFYTESVMSLSSKYFQGANGLYGATSGFYQEGEGYFYGGYMQAAQGNTSEIAITPPTSSAYMGAGAPDAIVTTSVVGVNAPGNGTPDHHLQIAYGAAPGTLVVDTVYAGHKVLHFSFTVPNSALGESLPVRFKAIGDQPLGIQYNDEQTPGYVRVQYPRNRNLNNSTYTVAQIPNDGTDIARLMFYNFVGTPIVYVMGDTVRRIVAGLALGDWNALVPQADGTTMTDVIIMSETTVNNITAITPVSPTGLFTNYEAMGGGPTMLIVAHESLMNEALAYASDRENSQRHPLNTVVADVDELYDQYGGGIPKHPLAIRAFCRDMYDSWDEDPEGLFLIGKSVQAHRLNNANASYRPDMNNAYADCLVPSFGYPATDNCYTIGLNYNPMTQQFPVGRLSAKMPQQVTDYRSKVLAFESQPPAAWMKNILHFRGGFSISEVDQFGAMMYGMKIAAEDTSFGGRVIDFKKIQSTIFQQASADSVRYFIEDEGVTLLNFFAHASGGGFDITIDDPSNYDWNGKHPMVIGNSCYIGNVHMNTFVSTPENWVMMPDAGPIAFMASTEIGLAPYLASYTTHWYESFSQHNYGKGLGQHMVHAAEQMLPGLNQVLVNTVHTFALQGDPTLILNSWPEPDYEVTPQSIHFDPDNITADTDTFQVKAVVTNIGRAVNNTIAVDLERTAPLLGAVQNYSTQLTNLYYKDTAYFQVPTMAFAGGAGYNTITVKVDQEPDVVPELEDNINNVATTTLFISSGDLIPVYPYDYAIIPDPNPTLKASTGDPFAPVRTYLFQIDTTDLYNSPIMESVTMQAPGGVVSWQPPNIFNLNSIQDSTVFYWRCTIDSTGNGSYNWYERSFQYITGEHGWGQAHYFQFKEDDFAGVVYDRPERDFDFFSGEKNLRSEVRGNSNGSEGHRWLIDLSVIDYGNGCPGAPSTPSFLVMVTTPNTFEPWGTRWQTTIDGQPFAYNTDHQFGNLNNNNGAAGQCRNRIEYFFVFPMNDPAALQGMADMLDSSMIEGHHILVSTWKYLDKAAVQANGSGLISTLDQITASALDFDALTDTVPYIFYLQKGVPASFEDTLGTSKTSIISLSVWVDASTNEGTITTMPSSAANSWEHAYWKLSEIDPTDSTSIIIQGYPNSPNSQPVTLYSLDQGLEEFDLSAINAQLYPRLRFKGFFKDEDITTPDPSQLKRWQFLSSPAPEAAIHPPAGFHNALVDLYYGQEAEVAVAVQNISQFDMDSLLMTAWVIDQNNVRHRIHYEVNAPLPAGAILMDTIHFSTNGLGGANTLIIEANPIDTVTTVYHQLEQFHFNNIATIRFDVDVDITNPLLDVTFDGIHILDGDIVSARPEIMVTLDDENTVLLLDSPSDTANFKVFLTRPGGQIERLYFRNGDGSENMQFLPATGTENVAKIMWRPIFEVDGTYQLAVEGTDESSNHSGDNRYQINFEVITRPTITEILNYPNPFTTNTRFVFTVTGHQAPTYMKIQIMTITGRVVREVTMQELGTIRVGRNMTDFAWDGTDQFGDRLARGVYIYKVFAKLNGEDIEYRETSAGQYFNKGFGKMYLLK